MKNFFLCTFLFLSFNFLLAQAVYNGSNKHTFTTNYGTIEIGPFNSNYGHIYTDRPKIIFNKPVWTTANTFSSYNNDLVLQTEGSTRLTIDKDYGYVGLGVVNPQSPLHVEGSHDAILTLQTNDNSWLYTNWEDMSGTRRAYMGLNNSLGEFRIKVENGTNEIILDGGNVGIGTFSPTSKLDVNGNIKATEHITVNKNGSYRIALNGTSHGYIYGRNDNIENKFLIHSNGNSWFNGGNVGIGHTNPDMKLDVRSDNRFITRFHHSGSEQTSGVRIGRSLSYSDLVILPEGFGIGVASNSGTLPLSTSNVQDLDFFIEKSSGKVGIGTTAPDSKLTVNGNIHAEEVKVDLNVPGPDYVFKEGYNLKSLEEVQNYIVAYGHLPNIPPAKEMEANGIQLGEMNMKLLEKIEELTLYTIQQQEKIKELEKANDRIQLLEEKLEKLSKIIIGNEKN